MAEETEQIALQRTVEGSRKDPYAPNDKNRRFHYTYTRRTGHCPRDAHKHKSSSVFVGVNEHGWIFRCSYSESEHLFVNPPPAHTVPEPQ